MMMAYWTSNWNKLYQKILFLKDLGTKKFKIINICLTRFVISFAYIEFLSFAEIFFKKTSILFIVNQFCKNLRMIFSSDLDIQYVWTNPLLTMHPPSLLFGMLFINNLILRKLDLQKLSYCLLSKNWSLFLLHTV